MSQQQAPWLETAYGWAYGESGWNSGVDSNFLKFSFLFDRNVDSVVATLPPAVNGQAHYNTTDNRIYFAVNTAYYSTPVPKWFTVVIRSTGETWQFNGTSLVQIESTTSLDIRLDSITLTVESLGTAAFEDVSAFATQAALDVVDGQSQAYTDNLRDDLSSPTGASLVSFKQAGIGAVARPVEEKLRDLINIEDFGAVGDGVTDCTSAIISAIAHAYSLGGGTVHIPSGVFMTDPISLQGFSNVTLRGSGGMWQSITGKDQTTLRIRSAGDVGVQFCATTNPAPVWTAAFCALENIVVDGNNLVRTCVNGNYDLLINKCTIYGALEDGITCEDFTYPLKIIDTNSYFNGRHGVMVRGPMTTKFNFDGCRFDSNEGYGVYIESTGGYAHIKDCTAALNRAGGLKIKWVGDRPEYTGIDYFCDDLMLTNFYTEASGYAIPSDPHYDGNFAFKVEAPGTGWGVSQRPKGIRFFGGALNPAVGGSTYKIDAVYGLEWNGTSVNHTTGVITSAVACNTIMTSPGASSLSIGSAPFPVLESAGISNQNPAYQTPFLEYRGGVIGTRGRVQAYEFYLPSITAGASTLMVTAISAGLATQNGFHMFQNGSVVGLLLVSRSIGGAGTLTASIEFGHHASAEQPNIALGVQAIINAPTQNRAAVNVSPMVYNLNSDFVVGVRLTASAGYAPAGNPVVKAVVLIES